MKPMHIRTTTIVFSEDINLSLRNSRTLSQFNLEHLKKKKNVSMPNKKEIVDRPLPI
jgi:hypothetical protein